MSGRLRAWWRFVLPDYVTGFWDGWHRANGLQDASWEAHVRMVRLQAWADAADVAEAMAGRTKVGEMDCVDALSPEARVADAIRDTALARNGLTR